MLRAALALFATCSLLVAQAPPPALAAETTVVLEGQVVDLRGEPVPMAKVLVATRKEPDRVLAQTMCDGEGRFRLGRVPRRASWVVRADSPGLCLGESMLAGEPRPVRILVHDAATLCGVLRDKAGAPVAGAIVRAQLMDINLHTRVDGLTDAEGRFSLPRVPLGLVRLVAVVAGVGLAEFETVIAGDTRVEFAPPSRATTSLKIAVEGLPKDALDVEVQILPMPGGWLGIFPPPWDEPRLDEKGAVELQPVPNWGYQVTPSATGFTFTPRYAMANMNQGPHLLKFKAARVDGAIMQCPALVRDREGKPLPGLRLAMRVASGPEAAQAISDGEGKLAFAVPLVPATEVVISSLDDRFVLDQDKDGRRMLVDAGTHVTHECSLDPATTLELRAVAASSVQGRVLLPDGQPAAFVDVAMEQFFGDFGLQWIALANGATDRQGHYSFKGCHHLGRSVRVRVLAAVGAATSADLALAEPGTVVAVPDLKLDAPASVEGTVVDERGRPAPGIRVWLFSRDKAGRVLEVITDRQGRWRFVAVSPGDSWLQVLVDQDRTDQHAVPPFEVEAGQRYTYELQLPKPK